jgi:proteasome accessory factor C
MATPKYVERIARLPRVFELLAAHPEGMALTDLAAEIDVPADELREDLLAFYTADPHDVLSGLSRPTVLEFFGPDGDDVDPNQAELVRVVDERPADELGVEYLNASELGLIYSAAKAQLDLDPDDQDLHDAVDVLTETMLGPSAALDSTPMVEVRAPASLETPAPPMVEVRAPASLETPAPWNGPLASLETAIASRRKVRIVYSRAWTEGVAERVIDPYHLVSTRRGWEVDAGPPDADGHLRTYLLPHIRECEVLDETYDAPADLPDRLKQQRYTTRVRVQIPQAARWAADFYAENVEVVDDDELATTLDLDLLPPVEHRVGLLLLIAGEDARVLQPARLIAAGPTLAAELSEHHRKSNRSNAPGP